MDIGIEFGEPSLGDLLQSVIQKQLLLKHAVNQSDSEPAVFGRQQVLF